MFKKIVVATDGSDGALGAARTAAEIAKKFDSEILVVFVYSMPLMALPYPGAPGMDIDPMTLARYAEEVQDSVSTRTGEVFEEAGLKYSVRTDTGNAADLVVKAAEEEGGDLIVIGSRGLSGLSSLLLGSVSDRVVHHAHCPVLVVK